MTPNSDRIIGTRLSNDVEDMQDIVHDALNGWNTGRIAVASIIQRDDMVSKAGHHAIVVGSIIRCSTVERSRTSNVDPLGYLPRSILSVQIHDDRFVF